MPYNVLNICMKSLLLGKQTKKMQMTLKKKSKNKKQIAPKKTAMIIIIVLFNLTPYTVSFSKQIISNRSES